jgi:HEAT repeat protein
VPCYQGGDQSVTALTALFDDIFLGSHAVEMLKQSGSACEAKVIPVLESDSAGKRSGAAKALQAVGTKSGAAALFKLLDQEKDANVRKSAQEALRTIAARQAAGKD